MSIETWKAIELVRDTLNERADDHAEDWDQISEAWKHICSKVKPDGKGARHKIEFLIDRLADLDVWCAELVMDSQDAAEDQGITSPGFFTGDNDDIPICVPEDANPDVDGVRCSIDEAMTALQSLLDTGNCPTCGARPGETHPRECADFEEERKRQEKHVEHTFYQCYKVELDVEWDGDDLVSSCIICKGDYGSSLAKADAEGTLDNHNTGEEILIPDAVVAAIYKWAEANGY